MQIPTLYILLHRHLRIVITLVALIGVAGCKSQSDQAGGGQGWAPPVTVMSAQKSDVIVEQDYAGRVRGAREVEVRTRVQGILEKRLFQEGQKVTQGTSLFRIDPKPFEVALQAALAEQQSAAADLRQAEREWQRIARLYEQNAVSRRERDNAQATRELAEARLALTEARVAQARLDSDYTRVAAPITGVTSLEILPEGSLVERGTLLTTIVQHDPVHVRFALPEKDAALLLPGNADKTRVPQLSARVVLPDGQIHGTTGTIDFTGSTVDPRTGTVSARAVFANPDAALIPGQFVRVRIQMQKLPQTVLIPETAVIQGSAGPSVFVIDDSDQAQVRPVSLGPVVQGQRAILEGIAEGDRVVINGQVALHPGMSVTVHNAEQEVAR